MPRVRVEDYLDFEDEMTLEIQEDDPRDQYGRKIQPKYPPKQDRDWEENRRAMIQRKLGKDSD